MKNQYFGDTRDLFKYDLVLDLLLKSDLKHFVLIPMLTENECNTHGGRINYRKAKAGIRRVILKDFLERCLANDRRNIEELENFFRNDKLPKKIELTIYKRNSFFSNGIRKKYFSAIKRNLLVRSIILVDPDIGLEIRSMKGREEKYIKYEEVKLLYYLMDKYSALLIFQFIPRVKRDRYFSEICDKLKKKVTREVVYFISDNQVAFFILIKGRKPQKSIEAIICTYANLYGLKIGKK